MPSEGEPLRPREAVLLANLFQGMSVKRAAQAMGMSLANAKRIVGKAGFKRAVAASNRALMEQVARGEFGAMTIAKAESQSAMQRLAEASRDPKLYKSNARVWLQANLEVIKLAGIQPPKPVVVESKERLIDLMSAEEAEEYATTGVWPERFRDQIARLSSEVIETYKRGEGDVISVQVEQEDTPAPVQVPVEDEEW